MSVSQPGLDNLIDALVEDHIETPEDEVLAEIRERGEDPAQVSAEFNEILNKAVAHTSDLVREKS